MTRSASHARARGWLHAWSAWTVEQRTAALAAVLLVLSTFGSFSFVEAALIGVAGAVLLLLRSRADGRSFALPLPDRTLLLGAGAWSAVLIAVRLFDRPLGQSLLAFFCAALLALAGLLERTGDDRAAPAEAAAPEPEPEPPARAASHRTPAAPRAPAGVTWLNAGPKRP